MHLEQQEENQHGGGMQVREGLMEEGMFTGMQVTEESRQAETVW